MSEKDPDYECQEPCHPDANCEVCGPYWERMIAEGFWDNQKGRWTDKGFQEFTKGLSGIYEVSGATPDNPVSTQRFFLDHGVIHDRTTGQHVAAEYEADWQQRLLALLNDQEQRFNTLASALHKFAPDLMGELRRRYANAVSAEKLALDEFLTFLRGRP